MKQEDKELLLRDLCARLPHKVIVEFISYEGDTSPWFGELSCKDLDSFIHDVEYIEIKPYLFPLSSMTEKQCNEFYCKFVENEIDYNDFKEYYFEGGLWHKLLTSIDDCDSVVNWFNKNHFDYRGLIEKGLALEAPKEMYN